MMYEVKIHDFPNDKLLVFRIEAPSVFDAIDEATKLVDNPTTCYLNSAERID